MPRQAPPSPSPQPHPVNPKIWKKCVGGNVEIHTINSRVYYFPQGHMKQASSPPQNLSPLLLSNPRILCTVTAVEFLADAHTDEMFAKLTLHPTDGVTLPSVHNPVDNDEDEIISSSKILTPSDAHNGGGFSVPKGCADNIFPRLNIHEELPVQTLTITDVHGKDWNFRHIFRGRPKRHLLTSGWGSFIDSKKLIAGDSVVFMKNRRGNKFIGIHRAPRTARPRFRKPEWLLDYEKEIGEENVEEEERPIEGFSRDGKGMMSLNSVVEAAELAAQNKPFEVVYYPKSNGWVDFVVKTEVVDKALSNFWRPGVGVKMAVESEDSSRNSWNNGMVSSTKNPENEGWKNSPWLSLKIAWDEPADLLKDFEWVNPWQVEFDSTSLYSTFPPTKKFRAADGSGIPTDGAGCFSRTGLALEYLDPSLLSYGTSPAGMQGARHNLFPTPSFPMFQGNNPYMRVGNSSGYTSELNIDSSRSDKLSPDSYGLMGDSSGNKTLPGLETPSTEQDSGSSKSDNSSADSQRSVSSFRTKLVDDHCCESTKPGLIKLFGVVIPTQQHVESCLHGPGSSGDGSNDSFNETKVNGNSLDDSLTSSKLLDKPVGFGK